MKTFLTVLGFLMIIGVVLYPLIVIWAVNTLFGLSIPITFASYIAASILIWPMTFKVVKNED